MSEPPSGWNPPDAPPSWTSPTSVPPPAAGYGPPYGAVPTGWYGAPVQPGIVPLRPLGLGELLDGAIKILRQYPRPTLGLSAAIAAVVTIINVALVLIIDSSQSLTSVDQNGNTQVHFSFSNASTSPGELIRVLAGFVLTGAIVAVVGKAVLGQQIGTSEVWATVRPRLWALVGLSLLTGLIVFAPLLLAVVLTVLLAAGAGGGGAVLGFFLILGAAAASAYFYTRFSLAPAALVLEKAGVTAALGRSAVLIKGAWWRTFWILVLTSFIGGVIGGILGVPLGIAAVAFGDSGSTGFQVAAQVAGGLAAVVVSPFTAGVRALLYVDRRMRAEGLDVALAAAAAGAPPA